MYTLLFLFRTYRGSMYWYDDLFELFLLLKSFPWSIRKIHDYLIFQGHNSNWKMKMTRDIDTQCTLIFRKEGSSLLRDLFYTRIVSFVPSMIYLQITDLLTYSCTWSDPNGYNVIRIQCIYNVCYKHYCNKKNYLRMIPI